MVNCFYPKICRKNVHYQDESPDAQNKEYFFRNRQDKETGLYHMETMTRPIKYMEHSMKKFMINTSKMSKEEKMEIIK